MTKESLPIAVWEGTFTMLGVTLRCAVLDNGQRVINAEDVEALMSALQNDDAITIGQIGDDVERFARWQKGLEP